MRILVAGTIALAASLNVIITAQKPTNAPETPRWVAEQVERRDTGRDARMEMTMRLFDRQGRARVRTMLFTALRASAPSAGDRVLIKFLEPNDIKGTGFLVWEHPKGDDERFLYLPALGRVRRIAGQEKQQSFVGSDLSYEDIGGRDLDDYTYTFAQRDAQWKAPDGQTHAVWQLESRAVDPDASYPRNVSFIRKDNFVIVAADVYNRRNEREKQYVVRSLRQIDGIWTALHVVMSNDLQHTRTELEVGQPRYNTGLTENDFSRRVLEQGVK